MAFYVRLNKICETAGVVRYRYSSDERQFGEAELDKGSGEVRIVQPLDGTGSAHISARAAAGLRREWRNGSLPDVTEWAS